MQDLQIGDEVETLAGPKIIKWIGYNKFTKDDSRGWQDSVMPVRVARCAIDNHTPQRDLYLSRPHCVFLNEAFIPVMYLINEASIAPGDALSDMSAIDYYHIDLDTHEVIYAEGALVESFFDDCSNRENFSNFVQYMRLYGAEHINPKWHRSHRFSDTVADARNRKGLITSLISMSWMSAI